MTPCEDRIEMAVRARARAILRRIFAGPQTARITAEDYGWLKHNLPEVVTQRLSQDCIAAWDGSEGVLVGPAAHAWGSFAPQFFLLLNGRTLA